MEQLIALIWNIADDVLRDVFLRGQYRDVILPMVVLRRLDALLEPTKEAVEQEYKSQIEAGLADNIDEEALKDESKQTYYNISKWTLNRLKNQSSDNNDINYANFIEYLNGYSENVKDVLKNFEFYAKVKKLADNDRLISIIERITDPRLNLTDRIVRKQRQKDMSLYKEYMNEDFKINFRSLVTRMIEAPSLVTK